MICKLMFRILMLILFVITNGLHNLKAAQVWRMPDFIHVSKIDEFGCGMVHYAEFSQDGTKILTDYWDSTARVWDIKTGKSIYTFAGHKNWVWSARFSPNGTKVVTASIDKTAKIWDVKTGNCLHTLTGHTDFVLSASFSRDGTKIVTASRDNTAKIWDVNDGKCLFTLTGHTEWVQSAEFSPDGSKIVTASQDSTAKVWDLKSREYIHVFENHEDSVCYAEFSPDGSKVVTASLDRTAIVWDVQTGKLLNMLVAGMNVYYAQFSPDGTKIVTATACTGGYSSVGIWDAKSGICLFTISRNEGGIKSAAFSPDGSKIVTASNGGIYVYTDKRYITQKREVLLTLALTQHKRLGEASPVSIIASDADLLSEICRHALPAAFGPIEPKS